MKRLTVKTREQLRKWFAKNHHSCDKVFLVTYKKHTGKPSISANERMREGICWGWIDTTVKRIDKERYGQTFVKRGPNARWSTNTIKYAKEEIAAGNMQPPGLKAYKAGLKKPIHDSDESKRATMPKELRETLNKNPRAKKVFDKYPPSKKKTYYVWIHRAKRPETREKRIKETVEEASQ